MGGRRPKDETDFTAVLPSLTREQRQWLSDAIARTHGVPLLLSVHGTSTRKTVGPPGDPA